MIDASCESQCTCIIIFLDQSPTKKSNLEEKVVEMDLLTTWREIHRLYSQPFF